MNRLQDPDDSDPSAAFRFNYSPDGRKVAIVVRQGDIRNDMVSYQLETFDLSILGATINSGKRGPIPNPRVLAKVSTRSPLPGIDRVTWAPNGRQLVYVARSDDGRGRAVVVNFDGSGLKEISPEGRDVVAFDVGWSCNHVLFTYKTPPDWRNRDRGGYVVGSQAMAYLVKRSATEAEPVLKYALYDWIDRTETQFEVGTPIETWWGFSPANPTLSADCSRAVIHSALASIPERWRGLDLNGRYATSMDFGEGVPISFENLGGNDAFGRAAPWIGQFLLVDLKSHETRALLDAPTGWSLASPHQRRDPSEQLDVQLRR